MLNAPIFSHCCELLGSVVEFKRKNANLNILFSHKEFELCGTNNGLALPTKPAQNRNN
jgi:hypothetical protein